MYRDPTASRGDCGGAVEARRIILRVSRSIFMASSSRLLRIFSNLFCRARRYCASLLGIVGMCPDEVFICLSRRSTRSFTDCAILSCSGWSSDVSREHRAELGFFCRSSAIGHLLIVASFVCLLLSRLAWQWELGEGTSVSGGIQAGPSASLPSVRERVP